MMLDLLAIKPVPLLQPLLARLDHLAVVLRAVAYIHLEEEYYFCPWKKPPDLLTLPDVGSGQEDGGGSFPGRQVSGED